MRHSGTDGGSPSHCQIVRARSRWSWPPTSTILQIVGTQAGSFPLLALDTADCVGDYKTLKTRGVIFHGEPTTGPWGTGVLLEDLYGNKIFLSQESSGSEV